MHKKSATKHTSRVQEMKKKINLTLMKKLFLCLLVILSYTSGKVLGQETQVMRTPEELKELFGYCDKPILIKKLNISSEIADKIGEIDYWARLEQKTISDNTNLVYATPGELQQEVMKKYKAIRLSDDQIKSILAFKTEKMSSAAPCPVITLTPNHTFDTLTLQRGLQLYKTKYRKALLEKAGINGRTGDLLLEIEVWKQKETLVIDNISITDFNRIRKTVAMHAEWDKRSRTIGLSDDQMEIAKLFFEQNKL